jgi:hypothetical protein
MRDENIKLQGDADVVAAWKSGLALGRRLGFGPFKQACLSSAILELSRNVVETGGGVCVLSDASDPRTRRARVVLRGAGEDLCQRAKQRLNADMTIGPALPAVKLHQIVESCDVEPQPEGAKISLTINDASSRSQGARTARRQTGAQ